MKHAPEEVISELVSKPKNEISNKPVTVRSDPYAMSAKAPDGKQMTPGCSYIGCGYDVFGENANAKNLLGMPVFDFSSAEFVQSHVNESWVVPKGVYDFTSNMMRTQSFSGKNIEEYQASLSKATKLSGGYSFFSASISSSFSKEMYESSEHEYSQVDQEFELWSLRVDVESMLPYLNTDIRKFFEQPDLRAHEVMKFYEQHGVYFLASFSMGGRLNAIASTKNTYSASGYDLEKGAELGLKNATGQLSNETKNKNAEQIAAFSKDSSQSITAIGGDPTVSGSIDEGDYFEEWRSSIPRYPALISFAKENALIMFSELVQSSKNKEMFELAAQEYLEERSKKVKYYYGYINSIIIQHARKDGDVPPTPNGYTKIYHDLNHKAGGDYVYAYFHLECPPQGATSFATPITDIDVIYDNEVVPEGYTKIDTNLNYGTEKGKRVYLCYKLGKATSEGVAEGIVDLTVVEGENQDLHPPYGYTLLKKDVNKGAGGRYIYFAYKKY